EMVGPVQSGRASSPTPVQATGWHVSGRLTDHSADPVCASKVWTAPLLVTTTTLWSPTVPVSSDGGSYTVDAPVRRPSYFCSAAGAFARHATDPARASSAISWPSDHWLMTYGPLAVSTATTPITSAGKRPKAHAGVAPPPTPPGAPPNPRHVSAYTRSRPSMTRGAARSSLNGRSSVIITAGG